MNFDNFKYKMSYTWHFDSKRFANLFKENLSTIYSPYFGDEGAKFYLSLTRSDGYDFGKKFHDKSSGKLTVYLNVAPFLECKGMKFDAQITVDYYNEDNSLCSKDQKSKYTILLKCFVIN